MTAKAQPETIYVALLEEGVDVWRPVNAVRVRDDVFRISNQPYDSNVETWEFAPGEEVVCEYIESSEGRILAARRRA